jgi:hypothetical protein
MSNAIFAEYRKWRKKYLASAKKEKPEDADFANDSCIKDQVDFIGEYMGFFALNQSPDSIKHAKHFLKMQTTQNNAGRMLFRFIGGSPIEIWLYADSKKDLDIADITSMLNFELIAVSRAKGEPWTRKLANELVEEIKDDLEFDGYEPKMVCDFDKHALEIYCGVQE